MRFFKISHYLGLSFLMLCIGIMTSQATQIEAVPDHTVNSFNQKSDELFDNDFTRPFKPTFQKADRHVRFNGNKDLNNFRFTRNAKSLLREEKVHKSVDNTRFNERFFPVRVDYKRSTAGIEKNLINYGVQGNLLHQRATNKEPNGEFRGWYTIGVVSALIITGGLIYFLSGDDDSTSIPEPPGRP